MVILCSLSHLLQHTRQLGAVLLSPLVLLVQFHVFFMLFHSCFLKFFSFHWKKGDACLPQHNLWVTQPAKITAELL